MMLLLLQFIDFKARPWNNFLRFIIGLASLPTQCHERSKKVKSLTKIFDLTAAKETRPFTAHCKKDMLK